ncbi:MAG: integrase family protein [Nitrospinae bacterium]|nr:integrase family protein [Nitrospinota bacterium]
MPVANLTKSAVDALPFTSEKVVLYYDEKLKGFGVRVSRSAKSYFAENRVNGKTRRVKIGLHGSEVTTQAARERAQKILANMNDGVDPNLNKREAVEKNSVTLERVFNDYLEARKDLKPKTLYDYRNTFRLCFPDWSKKPVADISQDAVRKRHKKIGELQGHAYANLAMRLLRALFNFSISRYGDTVLKNPVKGLSDTRAWYRVERRRTVIKPDDLRAVFDGLDGVVNTSNNDTAETVRDYVHLLVMTGLRRQEAGKLRWRDVDFTGKTLLVEDTKNRTPHQLPLTDFLMEMLSRRHKNKKQDDVYVFTGRGDNAHLVDPRKQLKKVSELSGVTFSIHDCRRTFASIGVSLATAYELKMLLNHKAADITGSYIVSDVESLRPVMQKICDTILRHAGRLKQADVIPITRQKQA